MVTAILTAALIGAVPVPVAAAETTTDIPVSTSCGATLPCDLAQDVEVTTDGTLRAKVTLAAGNCSSIVVRLSVDGALAFTSDPVEPGGSTSEVNLGPVEPGTHTLRFAYWPREITKALWISVTGLLLAVGTVFFGYRLKPVAEDAEA